MFIAAKNYDMKRLLQDENIEELIYCTEMGQQDAMTVSRESDGFTALHIASMKNNLQATKLFMSREHGLQIQRAKLFLPH